MNIDKQEGMGVVVTGFDPSSQADISELKDVVYQERIAVLKGLAPDVDGLVTLGSALGRIERYYEPEYHHPDNADVFVSSSHAQTDRVGVPRTGKFWHSDYQFMATPFDLTVTNPREVPSANRGTYFIDLGAAYDALPEDLRRAADQATAVHSVRRYFKIRPTDVYRPISEVIDEIDTRTPPVHAPAVQTHPHLGRRVLYLSEGFTVDLLDASGVSQPALLRELLTATGQLDTSFTDPKIHLQTFDAGDVLVWDNRSLVHRALHTTSNEASVTYRVTVHDRISGVAA